MCVIKSWLKWAKCGYKIIQCCRSSNTEWNDTSVWIRAIRFGRCCLLLHNVGIYLMQCYPTNQWRNVRNTCHSWLIHSCYPTVLYPVSCPIHCLKHRTRSDSIIISQKCSFAHTEASCADKIKIMASHLLLSTCTTRNLSALAYHYYAFICMSA